MVALACADELGGDAHLVAALAHRALEDVGHVKLPRDFGHLELLSFEGEGGSARCDLELRHLREEIEQLLRDAVGEILLVLRLRHVDEGQHGDRFFRRRERGALLVGDEAIRQQQDHGEGEDADDPEIQFAPGRMRHRVVRSDLALALQAGGGELVEPGEAEPERETDRRGHKEPARDPVGRGDDRRELRNSLSQRPGSGQIKRARAQHVAPL